MKFFLSVCLFFTAATALANEATQIPSGARVFHERAWNSGTVIEQKADGNVLVKFDDYERAWFDFSSHFSGETLEVDARDLGLSRKCDGGGELCAGAKVENTLVMKNAFEQGVIEEVFFSNDGYTSDNRFGKNIYRIKFEGRSSPALLQNQFLRKK